MLLAIVGGMTGCAHLPRGPVATPVTKEVVSAPDEDQRADAIETEARATRRTIEDRFINDTLGIEIAIPEDFQSRDDFENAQLAIRSPQAVSSVVFVPRAWNEHNKQRFFDWVVEQIGQSLEPGEQLVSDGERQPVDLEWSRGIERRWKLGNSQFTATLGPICGGRYTIAFVSQELPAPGVLTRGRWPHQLGITGPCKVTKAGMNR